MRFVDADSIVKVLSGISEKESGNTKRTIDCIRKIIQELIPTIDFDECHKWFSITDKMPEEHTDVLLYFGDGIYSVGYCLETFTDDEKHGCDDYEWYICSDVDVNFECELYTSYTHSCLLPLKWMSIQKTKAGGNYE